MAYRLHTPIILGFTSYDPIPQTADLNLSTANVRVEFGLLPHEVQTVSEVSIYITWVFGTPGTSIVCEICDASDTVIATATSPNITGVGWWDFTGLSVALSARQQHWIRFRNGHGTPASNSVVISYGSAGTGGISVQTGTDAIGWNYRETSTGGAPYTLVRQSSAGWQVKFADGSYQGLALESVTWLPAYAIYSLRKFGARFTSPSNVHLYLKAASITLGEFAGTPPMNLIAEVRNPTAVVTNGTSDSYPAPTLTTGVGTQRATFYFPTPPRIDAGGDYRLTICPNVNAGDVLNCYRPYSAAIRNSAPSRSVLPFAGTMQQTYYNGTTWADDSARIPLMLCFLDNAAAFGLVNTGSSGAGGLVGGGLVG